MLAKPLSQRLLPTALPLLDCGQPANSLKWLFPAKITVGGGWLWLSVDGLYIHITQCMRAKIRDYYLKFVFRLELPYTATCRGVIVIPPVLSRYSEVD